MPLAMRHALSLIDECITTHHIKRLYIAYSGGVDSSALLHLISQLKESVIIHAIHIHHGLSPNADYWLKHCQKQATQLGITLITHKLIPPGKRTNIENWARDERYAFFERVMLNTSNNLLLTAHHIEDQAETFLLQALRGSGLKGLACIATVKPFANGFLLRPFLHVTKNRLISYCQEHQLTWIEDESNQSSDYRRNDIRLNLMPKLMDITPSAVEALARSAKLCAEADELLHVFLTPHLEKISTTGNALDLITFNAYSELQQKYLLKMWLTQRNCYPSYAQFLQIHAGVQKAQSNWQYPLADHNLFIQNAKLLINAHALEVVKIHDYHDILNWLNTGLNTTFVLDDLVIRQRQAKDRCRPLNRHKSQSLKVIFQEYGISVHERKNASIIILKQHPDKIIAVHPFFVCH